MEPYWEFGDIRVFEQSRRVVRDGREIAHLREQQLKLLLHLLEHQDEVATKEVLQGLLWAGHESGSEHRLQTLVSELRKVLGKEAIATTSGRGYRFSGHAKRVALATRSTEAQGRPHEAAEAADLYVHPNGRFEKEGDIWKEYGNDVPEKQPLYTFREHWRDDDYIYLYDDSRRKDPGRPMYFRLPIRGGFAQWSYPNPFEWSDVMVVKPQSLSTCPSSRAPFPAPANQATSRSARRVSPKLTMMVRSRPARTSNTGFG